jgi:hypothetical protein
MVHYVSNPHIEVGGDSAIGIWYFLQPYTVHDGRPHWASGIYEDEYRRTLDGWRFRVVKITNFFACPYHNGWAGEEIGALTRAAAKSVDMRSM